MALVQPVMDRVELRVPADPAYLAVLRTASAGLAARLDLTLDEIEDLRIAVDEACALLLGGASGGPAAAGADGADGVDGVDGAGDLCAVFDIEDDVLAVRVTGPAPRLPQRSSFAWAVLEALAGEIEIGTEGGRHSIVLRHHRAAR